MLQKCLKDFFKLKIKGINKITLENVNISGKGKYTVKRVDKLFIKLIWRLKDIGNFLKTCNYNNPVKGDTK